MTPLALIYGHVGSEAKPHLIYLGMITVGLSS